MLRIGFAMVLCAVMSFCTETVAASAWPDSSWSDSSYFSWADYGFVTPVRHDQLSYSLCQVMSACAAIESQVLARMDMPDSNVDVAEQVIISCWCQSTPCFAFFSDMETEAVGTGIPAESCMAFNVTEPCDETDCEDLCDFPYAWSTMIDRFVSVETDSVQETVVGNVGYYSVDSLKRVIVEYGPVAMKTWVVFEDLVDWGYTGDVDCAPWESNALPRDSSRMIGHWVLFYGWNDSCRAFDTSCWAGDSIPCWLAKSSTGRDWGDPGPDEMGEDSGCFKMSMSEPLFRTGAIVPLWTPLVQPLLGGTV